jgi:lipid-binding SYLF domain-containing protein
MKYKLELWTICSIGLSLILAFSGFSAQAQDKKDAGDIKKAVEESRKEARESLETLNQAMKDPEKSVPRSLLQKAEAIAIFTNVKKGGLIVGGTGGDGVILRRTGNTWSAPVFYDIGGADVGFQIGATNTSYIMLFMTPAALQDLLDDKLELGAGVSAVAGPVGAKATANTNLTGNEAVLTYSNSEGLFAGATIGGATITADNSRNQALYKMNGGQVLTDPKTVDTSKLPAELRNLTAAVTKYAK